MIRCFHRKPCFDVPDAETQAERGGPAHRFGPRADVSSEKGRSIRLLSIGFVRALPASACLILRQAKMAIGELPLSPVPDGATFTGQAPAPEISVVRHGRPPAFDEADAIVLQRAPVIREEIDKFPQFVEDQFCRDGIGTKGKAWMVISAPGMCSAKDGGQTHAADGSYIPAMQGDNQCDARPCDPKGRCKEGKQLHV